MSDDKTKRILEYNKIKDMLVSMSVTPYGEEACNNLSPFYSIDEVSKALNHTNQSIKLILGKNSPPLESIPEIRDVLHRAKTKAMLSCFQIYQIGLFLTGIKKLAKFLINVQNELKENHICKLIERLDDLSFLNNEINRCLLNEEELKDNASPELSSIRKKIKSSQNEVKKILDRIVREHPDDLQEQLVTMRGSRYVVPVKTDRRNSIPGIVHDTSSSKATVFVEPFSVVEVNNKIREYISIEREETEKILISLTNLISEHIDSFYTNIKIIELIDFLNSKGKLAIQMEAMVPNINDKGLINLIDARHPLIPKSEVVPITVNIGKEYKTLVITGPNTGGKTVSLKTCGLLTLMAMSGLAIPAKETSNVSVFKHVCADIGDEQSIEQSLSTFSSHMTNLVKIINEASMSTLVLVDELGSGTDPTSGAALAISILEYFKRKGCVTLATTHYKELKHYAISTPGVLNASCEFDIETLRPTYKLIIGIPGVSNAFHISSRLGLSNEIIENAKSLITEDEANFEKLIEETQKAKSDALELERQSKQNYEKAKEELEKYEKLTQEVENKKDEILNKAKEEAKKYLEEEFWDISELIEDIKKDINKRDLEESKEDLIELRKLIKGKAKRVDGDIYQSTINRGIIDKPFHELTEGEMYFCTVFDSVGILDEYNKSKKTAILNINNKRINVPLSSLREVTEQSKKNINKSSGNKGHKVKRENVSFASEIKLLGLTVEIALEKLDKYIDDAVMSGVSNIRIVHGKGTGALRSAVNDMLKNDKRVSSFRLGDFGEGDSGVTIASLQ